MGKPDNDAIAAYHNDPDDTDGMTDGQLADYLAGFED